jgi:hypothetical protein
MNCWKSGFVRATPPLILAGMVAYLTLVLELCFVSTQNLGLLFAYWLDFLAV